MLTTLTLPALGLLMALSGIPGLKALPGLKGLTRHKPVLTAADSLPPAWRPASRLAIDRLIVRPGLPRFGRQAGQLTLNNMFDPRKVRIAVDPDSGSYSSAVEVGDMRLGAAYRTSLGKFGSQSMTDLYRDRWMERSRRDVNSLGTNATTSAHTGLSLPIPVQLPRIATSILGPGGPALNVSGSESIRLSGTSNWSNQTTGILGQKKSLFPSLDMQQDLDIRLEGQLSDRVKVNLLQNSANQVPLANRIAINYRGEEDDLIQALDLGNTSLSLPGTQYVSYSGKNEGLFGVKLASRIGPLDFTALASKQEGRSERASYSGGSARNTQTIPDLEYVKGQYFLLFDPGVEGNARFYDIDDASISLFKDDANSGNNFTVLKGKAMIDPDHAMGMTLSTLQDTSAFRGSFDLLKLGADLDYEIISNYYAFHSAGFNFAYKIIRLKQPIPVESNQCLAVAYKAKPINGAGASIGVPVLVGGRKLDESAGPDSGYTLLKILRAPRQLYAAANPADVNNSAYDSTGAFNPVRELEMKNFYQLSGFGIDPTTFKLTIQHGRSEPAILSVQPPGELKSIPYIEVLGLDNLDESTGQPIRGHDLRVDGSAPNSGARLFVDYQNGILWFPDPRPFAPRVTSDGGKPRPFLDYFMNDFVLNRRAVLDSTGDLEPNRSIYDKYKVLATSDAAYYLNVEYAASRGGGEITLGRGSIIDGSDVVTVNGERWKRDTDYTIDYDLGRISLKRQLGAADQLNIDYSYAPLFQQAGRTLIGSAFRLEGRDKSIGGAFLYESRGAQDLRPRLGEEPSRTLITDLNSEWRFRPSFLTRFANALPGIRTTTPSEFNVQAEVGASFPNPNTRNEVFIDDMEGVRDAVSLSLTPERWRWSSVPSRAVVLDHGRATVRASFLDLVQQHNAEVHWYSPPNVVHEKDLKPTLSDAQGGKNPRQVLAISIPHRPLSANLADTLWSGLTYPLDQVGLDLSRSQFIEIWVNDFHDEHRGAGIVEPRVRGDRVKLHIDLGVVSEDMMRAPDRKPNGILDSEDQPTPVRDHQLTVVDGGTNEDTGYDGFLNAVERDKLSKGTLTIADLTTASTEDPEGDDYRSPNSDFKDIDPRKYRFSNGTENNKAIYPYPDTEDLNLDDQLNTQEDYFEYTVDLGEGASPYLVTDVRKEFSGVASDNGWRRYRIPITDSLRVQFGVPDLTIARHVRLWIEGMQRGDSTDATERKPMVMLGGFDIVGSRWLASDLTTVQKDSLNTSLTLNSVNSLDNADVYVPPFDPGETRNTNQAYTRREQSLSMEFTELGATDTLEAYRTFSIEENYSRYGALNWYAAGFHIPGYDATRDSLFYFVRLATDERGDNYYEVKRHVPRNSEPLAINWEQVRVGIAELSNLKLATDFPKTDPILYRAAYGAAGDSVIIKGRPSFTRLRRISFGLINSHSVLTDSTQSRRFSQGQLWFDELRATEVAKDVGYANRLLVNGRVANLLSYNVAWNSRDADFLSVGESRGSGSRQTGLNVTSQFDVHRFFEGTGIQLPVSVVYSLQSSKPRFTAGDDVVRTGAQQAASETRGESKTVSTSYSRVWNDRSNPFLRYTVGGLTGNISRSQTDANSPTTIQHQTTMNAGVNYQVAPRSLLSIGLPFGKTKLFPLPERVYWNYQVNQNKSSTFTRTLDGLGPPVPSSVLDGRSANVDFGADTRPVDLISHHIEGRRALSLDPGTRLDKIGFINLGRLVSWRQSFSSRYALQRGPWLRPSMSWNSSYSQNNDVQSQDLSIRSIANGQNLQFNWDLPFDQINRKGMVTASGGQAFPAVDSTGKSVKGPRTRFTWRDLVARLGQVSADASLNRSSGYSRLTGTANFLYLAGLTDDPGFGSKGVQAVDGSVSNTGLEWRGNARTRIPVVYGSFLSTRASYGDRNGGANGVITRSRDWRFPDVDVDYGQVADALRLTRFLQAPQLRTSWTHSESRDYQGSETGLIGTSSSNDYHPLLSLRGNFKNGTTADLSVNKRSTVRESFQIGQSTATDQNTDLNLTLSRSYSQGQKVSFLGKTKTVRSNINLQLATVYSRHKGGTVIEGGNNQVLSPIDETRMSINGTGSYGFSSNVTGSGVLGFSTNRDKYVVRRSVRVEMRAQFTF
jgi:hypothetical protein